MNNTYTKEKRHFLVSANNEMEVFVTAYTKTLEVKGKERRVKSLLNLLFFKGKSINRFEVNANQSILSQLNPKEILLQLLANCAEYYFERPYDSLKDSERVLLELILMLSNNTDQIDENLLNILMNTVLVSNELLGLVVDNGIDNYLNNRKQLYIYDNMQSDILDIASKLNKKAISIIEQKSK